MEKPAIVLKENKEAEEETDLIEIEKDNKVQLSQKMMDYLGIKPGDKILISVEGLNNDVLVLQKA